MAHRAFDPVRLPPEFWTRARTLDALTRRDVRELLRLIQDESDATQTQLAVAIGSKQPEINAILNGRRKVTSLELLHRVINGFGMPDAAAVALLLGRIPAGLEQAAQVVPPNSGTGRHVQVRAHPLASTKPANDIGASSEPVVASAPIRTALSGPPLSDQTTTRSDDQHRADDEDAWDLANALTRSSLAPALVDRFERVALAQVARYPRTAPDTVWPVVRQELSRVRQALHQPQALATHRRLVTVLGILAGVAGNLAIDHGRPASAFEYFDLARLAGAEAEDPDLSAWALALASIELYVSGSTREAAAYLDQASALAPRTATARRRSWIAALRARAHAASGNPATAHVALDEARSLLDVADPPSGADFFDNDRLTGLTGTTYLHLGDSKQAAALVSQAIERRPPSDAKGRSLLLLDKADCHAVDRDPIAACSMIHTALDLAHGQVVRPILLRAREVTATMTSWHEAPEVRAVRDRLLEISRDASR